MVRQPGLFDLDERYRKLSEVGDPLMGLKELIDFELFRPALAKALRRCDGSKGGRPPYDAVLMFKVLILQTLYTLSDDATEFQIRDRFSFMRFLGLELQDAVPDAKTIWLFREQPPKAGAIDELFASFDVHLKASPCWGKSLMRPSLRRRDNATPRTKSRRSRKAASPRRGRTSRRSLRREGPRCTLDIEAREGTPGR
jgi:hypothetical protein